VEESSGIYNDFIRESGLAWSKSIPGSRGILNVGDALVKRESANLTRSRVGNFDDAADNNSLRLNTTTF
jgi:hypothetical protein